MTIDLKHKFRKISQNFTNFHTISQIEKLVNEFRKISQIAKFENEFHRASTFPYSNLRITRVNSFHAQISHHFCHNDYKIDTFQLQKALENIKTVLFAD